MGGYSFFSGLLIEYLGLFGDGGCCSSKKGGSFEDGGFLENEAMFFDFPACVSISRIFAETLLNDLLLFRNFIRFVKKQDLPDFI